MTARQAVRWALLALAAGALAASGAAAQSAGRSQALTEFMARRPECAGKNLVSKALTLRRRTAAEAAAHLEAYLGPCGAFTFPKSLALLMVTDEPENVERIGRKLALLDAPPRTVVVDVKLILGSLAPLRAEAPGTLAPLSRSLAEVTRYRHFQRLGAATIRVAEGQVGEARIGERHLLRFTMSAFDPEQGVVRLAPLELFETPAGVNASPSGTAPRRLLELAEVALPEGRENVVGATGRGGERALFVALRAVSAPQTPGRERE